MWRTDKPKTSGYYFTRRYFGGNAHQDGYFYSVMFYSTKLGYWAFIDDDFDFDPENQDHLVEGWMEIPRG